MNLFLRIALTLLLTVSFTRHQSWISSANFSKSEILTNQESEELNKILSARKINLLDSLINIYEQQQRFSGNVLVAIGGSVVFERAAGYADPIRKEPAQTNTMFQLASVSKQFTAAAIMLLQLDGRIAFDDPACNYLPELPYKDVKISQLLHHTSGLPNYMYLVDKYWSKEYPPDNEDIIDLLSQYKLPVYFRAGSRYDYSNTGYAMLATIVQRISGLSLNDFLQRRVFVPLGMNHTFVYSSADTTQTHRQIDGFRPLRRGYARIPGNFNNGPVGDKGVCSTLEDLFIWDQALYEGSPIPAELIEEAFSPTKTTSGKEVPYGYGFRIREVNGEKVVYHNGVWEGFRTNFHRYTSQKNTIILLNNTSIRSNHELVHQIESIINDQPSGDPTRLLVNLTLEEGFESAFETYLDLTHDSDTCSIDFATISNAAEFMAKAGKPEKASELEKFREKAIQAMRGTKDI